MVRLVDLVDGGGRPGRSRRAAAPEAASNRVPGWGRRRARRWLAVGGIVPARGARGGASVAHAGLAGGVHGRDGDRRAALYLVGADPSRPTVVGQRRPQGGSPR